MPLLSSFFAGHLQLPATIVFHITVLLCVLLVIAKFFHRNPIVRHNLLLSAFIGVALISLVSPVFYWVGGARLQIPTNWLAQEKFENKGSVREPNPISLSTSSIGGVNKDQAVLTGISFEFVGDDDSSNATSLEKVRKNNFSTLPWKQVDQGNGVGFSTYWQSVDKISLFCAIFLGVWIVGATAYWFRLYWLARRLRIIGQNAIQPDARTSRKYATILKARYNGLAIQTTILHSYQIQSPISFGVRNPIIIFPAGLVEHYTSDDLSNILVHETAHILRYDYLINLFQKFIKGLFWFHPLVHIADGQLEKAREEVCDNYVVHQVEPVLYSETLYKVSKLAGDGCYVQGGLGMSNLKWNLEERIRGLLLKGRQRARKQSTIQASVFLIIFLSAPIALSAIHFEFQTSSDTASLPTTVASFNKTTKKLKDPIRPPSPKVAEDMEKHLQNDNAAILTIDEEPSPTKPKLTNNPKIAIDKDNEEDGYTELSAQDAMIIETEPPSTVNEELHLALLPSYEEASVEALETSLQNPTATQFAKDNPDRKMESNSNTWQPVQLLVSIPKYPWRALKWEREGYCIVEFTINEQGSVEDAIATLCTPEGVFDRASVKAVKEYRFIPKFEDNNEVGVSGLQVKLTYQLQNENPRSDDFDRDWSYRVSPGGINAATTAQDGQTGSILIPRGIEPETSRVSKSLAKALSYQNKGDLSRLKKILQKLEGGVAEMRSIERYAYYYLAAKAAELENNQPLAVTYYAKLLDIDYLPPQYKNFANLQLAMNERASIGDTTDQ